MEEEWKPKLKMIFDSVEDAWKFWVDYGGKVGFGVRKQYSHKNRNGVLQAKGFKNREGKRSSKRGKGWLECQPDKRKKNSVSKASHIQKNKGHAKDQFASKEKDDDMSDSQTQVHYEISNSGAAICLNDLYIIQSMENNNTLSQFGVNSFMRLLMENIHGDDVTDQFTKK